MPITKYTASADTTITNALKPPGLATRATGSNMGASDAVQIFSLYGQASSSAGTFTSVEKSRVLVKFPITDVLAARNKNKIPASGSVSFYLNLSNARTPFTLPKDYTLRVQPVLRTWDEGAGLDMETYIDTGHANWVVASSASNGVVTNWTHQGGDFEYNSMFEANFPVGNEDMSIDVTSLVEEWLGTYNSWAQTIGTPVRLTGSQPIGSGSWLGYSSALSRDGHTASFGAPYNSYVTGLTANQSGSVRIFESGSGTGVDAWAETVLTASNGIGGPHGALPSGDFFGQSVSMAGDGKTVVVGAPYHAQGLIETGSAYIFTSSANWSAISPRGETAELSASDGANGDKFGYSVAISKDDSTIVVGANSHNGGHGAAYVYVKSADWLDADETVKLQMSAPSGTSAMGAACAISRDGSTIVVSAPDSSISGIDQGGALYLYEKPTNGWGSGANPLSETAVLTVNSTEEETATAFDPAQLDISGDGNIIVAGTTTINSYTGSAYVYEKPSTGWASMTETIVLTPLTGGLLPRDGQWLFGSSVSISEDGRVISVGATDTNDTVSSGSAFLFEKSDSGYISPTTYSIARTTNTGIVTGSSRYFGFSTALNASGTILAVGERGPNVDSVGIDTVWLSGSGYMFERPSTGTRSNYGVGVFLKPSQEDGSEKKSYYIKKFFARGTEYFFKKPTIEARWDDSIKDDRGDFYLSSALAPASDNLNTLYLYNYIRGRLRNIPAIGTGSILMSLYSGTTAPTSGKLELPSGGGLVTTGHVNVTGAWVEAGVYSASFATTSSVSQTPTLFNRFARSSDTVVEYLYDVWHSGTTEYFTGSGITPQSFAASNIQPGEDWVTTITNLKTSYKITETPRFRIFTRPRNWSPSIYTVATTAIAPTILRDSYYKVFRIYDNLDAVSYGTGSIKYTQVSYDVSGSYFDFNVDLLEPGYAYGIKIMSIDDGVELEHPETFKFRVE